MMWAIYSDGISDLRVVGSVSMSVVCGGIESSRRFSGYGGDESRLCLYLNQGIKARSIRKGEGTSYHRCTIEEALAEILPSRFI